MKPYTLEDVISELNAVQPHDWRGFFEERVYRATNRAPLGGIEAGGWRLVYRDSPSPYLNWRQDERQQADLTWSIGLSLKDDGTVIDVVPGLAADKAGIAPATQVIAVNGRQFSPRVIRQAITAAKAASEPIELLVKNGEYYRTHRLDYHEGEKYPWLERDSPRPDLLTEIIRQRVDPR
jgi:predicted metalloprotease with PDZ domain